MRADQPCFSFMKDDVTVSQLNATRPDTLYLPSFKDESCLKLLFDVIIVAGFFVSGDQAWYFGWGGLLVHGDAYIITRKDDQHAQYQ